MLKSGDRIIHFETEDIFGRQLSSTNFDGDYLLLSFLRGASCPFCNLRFMEYLEWNPVLKQENVIIYAFFNATNEELRQRLKRLPEEENTYVIADHDLHLHNLYSVSQSYMGQVRTLGRVSRTIESIKKNVFSLAPLADPPLLPADILVDKSGLVMTSYHGKDFADHLSMSEILELVRL